MWQNVLWSGSRNNCQKFWNTKHTGCLLLSSSSHDAIAAVPLEEVTLQLIFRPQVQLTQSLILYPGFAAVRNLSIQLFETRILKAVHVEIVDVNAWSHKQEFWYWFLQYQGRYISCFEVSKLSSFHGLLGILSFRETLYHISQFWLFFPSFGAGLKLCTGCVLSCLFVFISSQVCRSDNGRLGLNVNAAETRRLEVEILRTLRGKLEFILKYLHYPERYRCALLARSIDASLFIYFGVDAFIC